MNENKDVEECCVCYEPVFESDKLSCNHLVHFECIYKSKKSKCPLCRADLFFSKEQGEKMVEFHEEYDVNDDGYVHFYIQPMNAYQDVLLQLFHAHHTLVESCMDLGMIPRI